MTTFIANHNSIEVSPEVVVPGSFKSVPEGCKYLTQVYWKFNISNNSSSSITYDLTGLVSGLSEVQYEGNGSGYSSNQQPDAYMIVSGSMSGTINPQSEVSVNFNTNGPLSSNTTFSLLQQGAVPLLTVGGAEVCFRFWTQGVETEAQDININQTNGFTVMENANLQNNAEGNGYLILLGGGGGTCETLNICIQVQSSS